MNPDGMLHPLRECLPGWWLSQAPASAGQQVALALHIESLRALDRNPDFSLPFLPLALSHFY